MLLLGKKLGGNCEYPIMNIECPILKEKKRKSGFTARKLVKWRIRELVFLNFSCS